MAMFCHITLALTSARAYVTLYFCQRDVLLLPEDRPYAAVFRFIISLALTSTAINSRRSFVLVWMTGTQGVRAEAVTSFAVLINADS